MGQFTYSTPPGVLRDRLRILQNAFIGALKDPELLAEAKKLRLEVNPIDGPTTARRLAGLYKMEPALIAKLKLIVLPKK